jgi:hypothetical protein
LEVNSGLADQRASPVERQLTERQLKVDKAPDEPIMIVIVAIGGGDFTSPITSDLQKFPVNFPGLHPEIETRKIRDSSP